MLHPPGDRHESDSQSEQIMKLTMKHAKIKGRHTLNFDIISAEEKQRTVEVYATPEEIQQLATQGYLLRERLFQEEELEKLREAIDFVEAKEVKSEHIGRERRFAVAILRLRILVLVAPGARNHRVLVELEHFFRLFGIDGLDRFGARCGGPRGGLRAFAPLGDRAFAIVARDHFLDRIENFLDRWIARLVHCPIP